jgi:nucleotide-binding universal stress UspA family protein
MALATYAREMEVDLVVMTTHGRSGLSRMWLGSVADGVVRRSQVPVLLLRPSHADLDYDEELRPAHILCPLDGSELSRGILDAALWLGGLSDARYTLLRVTLPVPLLRPQFVTPEAGNEARLTEEEQARAKAEMEQLAAPLRERGLHVETEVVSHGVPAVAILDYAATHAVDLIALATHGRGGWSRLALGSVADKVLRGSLMPVLVYRPPAPAEEPNGAENGHGARARA